MYACEIKHRDVRPTLSIRFHAPVQDLSTHLSRIYSVIATYLDEIGVKSDGPAFCAYYNMDMNNLDAEAGFIVPRPVPGHDEIIAAVVPPGWYGVCHYVGPYQGIGPAYEELTRYIAEKRYAPSGVAYEWYYDGPDAPPEKTRTDIEFPVTKVEMGAPLPH